jgi:hypothetical protein
LDKNFFCRAVGERNDKRVEEKIMKKQTLGPALSQVSGGGPGHSAGEKSIEQIYQKKTQLEHILLRPDSYIGSIQKMTQPMWVLSGSSPASAKVVQKTITYVPGLYKIFDEILVNAADNKQRDPHGMNSLRVSVDAAEQHDLGLEQRQKRSSYYSQRAQDLCT